MRTRILAMAMALPLVAAIPAVADGFYTWTDDQGVTHYTDSPGKIPARFRQESDEKTFDTYRPQSTIRDESVGAKVSDYGASAPATAPSRQSEPELRPFAPPVPNVTAARFDQEVIGSGAPVLVDFWASWCGPCKRMDPVVASLAMDYAGKVKFLKVDIEREKGLTARFGVRSFPTFALFKGGTIVRRHSGGMSAGRMKAFIDGS